MLVKHDNDVWQFGIVHEVIDGTDIYSLSEVYLRDGVAHSWCEPNLFSDQLETLKQSLEDIQADIEISPVFEASEMLHDE